MMDQHTADLLKAAIERQMAGTGVTTPDDMIDVDVVTQLIDINTEPPEALGAGMLKPRYEADAERVMEIAQAISRQLTMHKAIPEAWYDELDDIIYKYIG